MKCLHEGEWKIALCINARIHQIENCVYKFSSLDIPYWVVLFSSLFVLSGSIFTVVVFILLLLVVVDFTITGLNASVYSGY